MTAGDVQAILPRLCLAGPLLYVGLLMIIDPGWFMRLSGLIAYGIRNFEQRCRGLYSQALFHPHTDSPRLRSGIRLAGVVVSAAAVAYVAVIPR
jgi:hypothetical protein